MRKGPCLKESADSTVPDRPSHLGKARLAVARKLGIRLPIMLRDEIDYPEFCRSGRMQASGATELTTHRVIRNLRVHLTSIPNHAPTAKALASNRGKEEVLCKLQWFPL